MEEKEIVNLLLQGPDKHNRALAYIFDANEFKRPVLLFLSSKGLSSDESLSLWTDIVVKFGLLVKNGKYQDQEKMSGYLKNLANYMALNYFRDQRRLRTVELDANSNKWEFMEEATSNHGELKQIFETLLSTLGQTCKFILTLWSQGYSMQEIMDKNKFASLEATRKRKHICLKRLLHMVDSNSEFSTLLQDYKIG